MRAIQVSGFGPPEVLRLAELPDPAAGPGEVAIDVTHAAVGLIDVFIRQGLYRDRPGLPQPPYVPGLEVAGTVRALGEGVAGFEVGEPVVTLSAGSGAGGYAAIFVSDAAYVASLKDVSLDPALAVAVVPNGATAYLALTQIARMHDGERVLVHGALGGLAAGFPGIARQLGASRVTGTVRASDLDAAQQATLPYDEIIDSAQLPARLAGGRFDIVIDPVGGSVRTASIDLLAPGDACSWSVTLAETGITRSTATGSGGGTWLFSAFRRGPSCRATRISRGPPLQPRSWPQPPASPRPMSRHFPSPARQWHMNGWRTTR